MKSEQIEKILNRNQYNDLLSVEKLSLKKDERILISGANGSIGTALADRLKSYSGIKYITNDIYLYIIK